MTAYLGTLGLLVPIGEASSLDPTSERSATFRTTIGGTVKARLGARAARRWSLNLSDVCTPNELANLAAFAAGEFGSGPWAFADEWAQVTNLLTPRDAALEVAWSNTVIGGPSALDGSGIFAGRTLTVGTPSSLSNSLSADDSRGVIVPVLPSSRITLSAWLNTAGSAIGMRLHDAAGAVLSIPSATKSGVGWGRVSTTVITPSTAAYARLYMTGGGSLAKPALTWSDQLLPYHAGQGVSGVTLSSMAQSVTTAWGDPNGQRAGASTMLVEVG